MKRRNGWILLGFVSLISLFLVYICSSWSSAGSASDDLLLLQRRNSDVSTTAAADAAAPAERKQRSRKVAVMQYRSIWDENALEQPEGTKKREGKPDMIETARPIMEVRKHREQSSLSPRLKARYNVEWTEKSSDSQIKTAAASPSLNKPLQRHYVIEEAYVAPPIPATHICCADVLNCVNERRGHFWRASDRQCLPLPGWNPSLKSNEIADGRLVCAAASNGVLHNNSTRNVAERKSIHLIESDETSLPASSPSRTAFGPFRAFHDPALEDLYVLQNFCVSPTRGFMSAARSSSSPSAAPSSPIKRSSSLALASETFRGREETGGTYNNLDSFRDYLSSPKMTHHQQGGRVHIAGRAILFPLSPGIRSNLGHTTLRIFSLLSIVRLLKKHPLEEDASVSSLQQKQIVLVLVELPARTSQEEKNDESFSVRNRAIYHQLSPPEAIRFFLDALDLPFFVVRAVSNTLAESASALSAAAAAEMAKNEVESCFRSGVAWQNHLSGRDEDANSYSFGIWVNVGGNANRMAAVEEFRRLVLHGCLHFSSPSQLQQAAPTPNSAATLILPKLVFDVRTLFRKTMLFGLSVDLITQRLRGFVQLPILFTEPFAGSAAEYVKTVHEDADLFAFVHSGAAFPAIALMRPGSHAIEITSPFFSCFQGGASGGGKEADFAGKKNLSSLSPRCWYGGISDAVSVHHTMVLVPDGLTWARARIPPGVFVDSIKASACRWIVKKNSGSRSIPRDCVDLIPPPSPSSPAASNVLREQHVAPTLNNNNNDSNNNNNNNGSSRQQQQQVTLLTRQQLDEYDTKMIQDIALKLVGVELSDEAATSLLLEMRWLRDSVTAENAPHVYLEGCPVDFWQALVDQLIAHAGVGVVKVNPPLRRRSARKTLAKLAKIDNPPPGKSDECCWCLEADKQRFFARNNVR